MRKFTALIAAGILALAALAPAAAEARDGRGRGWGHYDRHYDRGYYRHHDHDDDGDAVAAGAVGLILGLAIGSLASQPRNEPPPRYYERGDYYGPPQGSYGGSAYERDYGYAPGYYEEPPIRSRCMRAERQWDRYAGRYVTVDVPC
jgi:hypothetical protein